MTHTQAQPIIESSDRPKRIRQLASRLVRFILFEVYASVFQTWNLYVDNWTYNDKQLY